MKKLILFLMFVPCFYLSQIKTGTFSDLEMKHQENSRPVIIHIYTDWCSVCKIESYQLNRNKDLVSLINDKFYYIDFEAEKTKDKISFQGKEFAYRVNGNSGIHELALALSKNKRQSVYPLWIILDRNLQLVDYHEGQFKPKKLKQKLEEILSLSFL